MKILIKLAQNDRRLFMSMIGIRVKNKKENYLQVGSMAIVEEKHFVLCNIVFFKDE